MPQNEKSTIEKPYTGFVAHYNSGRIIKEREDFFSKKLNRKCSTNWAEIDRDKLVSLELFWQDILKAHIDKIPIEESFNKIALQPTDWFFSQNGCFNLTSRKITVIARNIGYTENGIQHIISVREDTGIIRVFDRAA